MDTACPICKKIVPRIAGDGEQTDRSFFPFCSERCKLIDLGRWLDGKYQIPAVNEQPDEPVERDGHDMPA